MLTTQAPAREAVPAGGRVIDVEAAEAGAGRVAGLDIP
jgi:hypothetical protein